ncbi:TonB-dependent receptor [Opitutus sp. ER46]|uniref:TonB-dependent siderophore receptor n=1 Tax=Opitutus sp. ER46 TaxID=2161864 RepID=UPI0013047D71|nr:TonB-dependent receptor [Opitutus sp. ER46]
MSSLLHPLLRSLRSRAIGCLMALLLALVPERVHAGEGAGRRFHVAAGEAAVTLREFSAQAGVQLLVSSEDIRGVRTHAVNGTYAPLAALQQMLAQTRLIAREEPTTGAIAVLVAPATGGPDGGSTPTAKPRKPTGMKSSNLVRFAAGLIAAGFSSAMQAQTAPDGRPAEEERVVLPTFTVDASKDTGYIGSNSLSASRAALSITDIPSSVVVITRQLLDDVGAFDLSDALRFVSGVSDAAMPGQDSGAFKIRGTGPTVSTDGFRVTGEGTQDLAEIERIEVLKGPSAILFARGGSAGGTVNRVTKDPRPVAHGYVRVQTGLFDANRVEVDSTGPVPGTNKQLLYRAVIAVQDDDAFFENVSTKRYVFSPAVTYKFSEDAYATLKYGYYWNKQTQYVGVPIDLSNPAELRLEHKLFNVPTERTTSDPNEYQFTRRNRLDFRSGVKLSPILRTSLNAQYMYTDYLRTVTRPNGSPLVQSDGTIPRRWAANAQQDYRYRLYSDNVLQYGVGPTANTTIFGFDLLQEGPGQEASSANVQVAPANLYRAQTPIVPTPVVALPWVPRSMQRSAQAYAMHTLKAFSDRLIATGGITRNWVNIDNYAAATGTWTKQSSIKDTKQYGVVVKPVTWASLYYGYNENFDAQFVRLGALQPDGSYVDGGAAPPRMSVSDEYGVKFSLPDGRLSWSIAHFDTELTNRTRSIVGTSYQELLSGGKYQGWESDLFWRPTDNLSLIATYSYTDAVDGAGKQIETVAPTTLSGLVRYDFKKGLFRGLGVSVDANYQNEYVMANGSILYTVAPRTLMDAGLFYTWKKYRFQVNVNNLTDKKYIAGGYLPQRVFLGAGRNVRFSATYTW